MYYYAHLVIDSKIALLETIAIMVKNKSIKYTKYYLVLTLLYKIREAIIHCLFKIGQHIISYQITNTFNINSLYVSKDSSA